MKILLVCGLSLLLAVTVTVVVRSNHIIAIQSIDNQQEEQFDFKEACALSDNNEKSATGVVLIFFGTLLLGEFANDVIEVFTGHDIDGWLNEAYKFLASPPNKVSAIYMADIGGTFSVIQYNTADGNECYRSSSSSSWACKFSIVK